MVPMNEGLLARLKKNQEALVRIRAAMDSSSMSDPAKFNEIAEALSHAS